MPLKLQRSRYFEVTQHMMEVLAYQHGAIDPDSGHIVCHQYRLGVTMGYTRKGPVPFLVVENCLLITAGKENVEAVLEDSVEANPITVRSGKVEVGGIQVDSYWLFAALSYAKDLEGEIYMYKLDLERDDGKVKAVAVAVRREENAVLVIVPSKCEPEKTQPKTHM